MHGINVNDSSLSVEVIDEACRGEGHYLGNNQTLELMETEFIYPVWLSRESIDDWQRNGRKMSMNEQRDRTPIYPLHILPILRMIWMTLYGINLKFF